MPIIKECNLLVLRDLYGTNLEGLDSRVTGRKVLSGDTPGISPCYGEWIEVVIKLTVEEIERIIAVAQELERKKAAFFQASTEYENAEQVYNEAKTAYENAKPDDDEEEQQGEDAEAVEQLKQAMDTARNELQSAEQRREDAVTEIMEIQQHDRTCIFRFENPSPIEIFQVSSLFVLKEGTSQIHGVMSNLPPDKVLITILSKRRADGWYDCSVLLMVDDNLSLENFQNPVNIFIRFWRLYN